MSKRYVIQVNAGTSEMPEWENVQHPSGGDWMTRSKNRALNDAVTLVFKGENRELQIAVSEPVYSVTPVAELDVAEAVQIAKQITFDTAAEIAKHGYGEPGDDDYIAPQFEVVDNDPTGN